MLRSHRLAKYALVILLGFSFLLIPIGSQTPQNSSGFFGATAQANLPKPPAHLEWHEWAWYFGQALRWILESGWHEQQNYVGSFTASFFRTPIPSVKADSNLNSGIDHPNYFDPSFQDLGGGVYEYSTSFGYYTLTPSQKADNYSVTFRSTTMQSGSQIASTFFVLADAKNGKAKAFDQISTAPVNITVLASNQFQAVWELSKGNISVGQIVFTVDFGKTSLPKLSIELVRYSYQVDPNCVPEVSCQTGFYWDDAKLGDFAWYWVVVPSSGYDQYQSKNYGVISLSSIQTGMDGMRDSDDSQAQFVSSVKWFADWNTKGKRPIQFSKNMDVAGNQGAVTVQFDLNDFDVDPTFGISTTGSTSYPTTTDTVGTTANNFSAFGLLLGYVITASASGVLVSVGLDIQTAAGHIRTGIYSTFSGNKFSGLLCQSASTVPVGGWNDLACTATIVAGTTYYVVEQTDSSSCKRYYANGGSNFSISFAYAAFPDPTGTLSAYAFTGNMRIIYNPIKGNTIGTRVQYTGPTTGSGSASSFSFYTHTGAAGDHFTLAFYDDSAGNPNHRLWYSPSTSSANTTWNTVNYATGTADNSWAGALTNNAYYWFMWQWDNTDSGPSYAAGGANTGIFKAQAYGTLNSTWSGGTLSTQNWSMYLTYAFKFAISDSSTGSDSLTRTFTGGRTEQDSGSSGETAQSKFTGARIVGDAGSGTETLSIRQVLQKIVSDSANASESVARQYIGLRTSPDSGSGSETVSIQQILQRIIADLGSGNETLSISQLLQRITSDSANASEAVTRQFNGSTTPTDTGTGNEQITKQFTGARTTSDSGLGSETLTINQLLQRIVADSANAAESVSRQYSGNRVISDTGSGSDLLSRIVAYIRGILDLGTGSETVNSSLTPATTLPTGGGGGYYVMNPGVVSPLFFVGTIYPIQSLYTLPASATGSFDVTVQTNEKAIVSVEYWLEDSQGKPYDIRSYSAIFNAGSTTETLTLNIPSPGSFTFHATAKTASGQLLGTKQGFTVTWWDFNRGAVTLVVGILALLSAVVFLNRKWHLGGHGFD